MKLCGHDIGIDKPFFLIAGPCVIESEDMAMRTSTAMKEITDRLGIPFIYKSSFDKANRTSGKSFRGPGLDEGLKILAKVKSEVGVPVLTDVHEKEQVGPVSEVVDVMQTPAFLARQTDFICAVAERDTAVNIKKAQFMAPGDMANVVEKARDAAKAAGGTGENIMVCERGASFGYQNLVSDMRGLAIMRETGCPVVFDATHSVQLPGGKGTSSGGQREFVPVLARAAIAAGISGVFMETHPDPANAKSDGPNAWPLDMMEGLLSTLKRIDDTVKSGDFAENAFS
ncbi:3-deoxy-8-phosphooctulonate synthase [Aurantiacibacter gangjinensis]|uniref:2-dehydro-3-deoxyphosphooctonate aldolase n=1 Tax=Aurantiacibacter gangjinensis TaxID=502682 RepID=A0A0G9MMC5_9SPHN|nr:3-deoxy-8-phosphooctulonate synthase [Aurantiacibacter gangjinensis]APE27882.1 2-Keto-3-deoxy-D-manno-octulosonate-8-phosphate synthase [Aurantiacibacter gangjinensis]KLE31847.1 2-dehydro-3-deoxyphosphooctonate aldolase [Aurantiacibacter gangjinensis]